MTIPKHLSADSRRIYRKIAADYELTEDSGLILQAALESWDRCQQARSEIAKGESLLVDGKRNPLIDIERQAYSLFLRAFRQLGLDITPLGPHGAPVKRF